MQPGFSYTWRGVDLTAGQAGEAAGWKANSGVGHCLINRTDRDAVDDAVTAVRTGPDRRTAEGALRAALEPASSRLLRTFLALDDGLDAGGTTLGRWSALWSARGEETAVGGRNGTEALLVELPRPVATPVP